MIIMHASSMIIINIIILTPKTARKNRGTELRCWVTLSFHQAAPYENEDTTRQRRVGTWGAKRKRTHRSMHPNPCVCPFVRPEMARWLPILRTFPTGKKTQGIGRKRGRLVKRGTGTLQKGFFF